VFLTSGVPTTKSKALTAVHARKEGDKQKTPHERGERGKAFTERGKKTLHLIIVWRGNK